MAKRIYFAVIKRLLQRLLVVICLLFNINLASYAAEFNMLLQGAAVSADKKASWQNSDTGILRYDEDSMVLNQTLMHVQQDFGSSSNVQVDANYYPDREENLGITQLQYRYKPLSINPVRFKARAGFFYPSMSLENVEQGWLSPYTYTQSAINSWIGEELRILGAEGSLYSPGRIRRSPWSWAINLGAFRGNDPFGTILSYRGFAMHDRQSLAGDRVLFAPYPSVVSENLTNHPPWVEPFHEIDGRTGFYLGLHADYFRQSSVRYYYYDNQGDPTAVNSLRLYAWETRFHSLAIQHKLNNDMRLIAQWLYGTTHMGYRFVYIRYDAWYLMFSYAMNQHRFSIRYDQFDITEDDKWLWDYNESNGEGFTMAFRTEWSTQWHSGIEYHTNESWAKNRMTLGQPTDAKQQQLLFVLQFNWK